MKKKSKAGEHAALPVVVGRRSLATFLRATRSFARAGLQAHGPPAHAIGGASGPIPGLPGHVTGIIRW